MENSKSNNKFNIKNNFVFLLFIIAFVLAIILLATTFHNSQSLSKEIYSPDISKAVRLTKVELMSSDGTKETVTLPILKSTNSNYSYNFTVDKDINDMQQYINVNIKNASFVIRYNNDIIYDNKKSKSYQQTISAASYNLIKLSPNYFGKKLTIEFNNEVPSNRVIEIPSILIGTKNEIRKDCFYNELFNIIAGISLFVTGIFIYIIGLFFFKVGQASRNLFTAVIFSITTSFYVLFKNWIVVYYLENNVLVYFMEYTSLMILPIPIILFYTGALHENKYYNLIIATFKLLITASFANLVIQWAFTLSRTSQFVTLQKITFFILIITGFAIALSIISLEKNTVKEKPLLILSLIPMTGMIISSIIPYYTVNNIQLIRILVGSITAFLCIHFVLALKNYVLEYNLAIEDEFYSQLAYFDTQTQLSNRHAFEKIIKEIESNKINFSKLNLIMLDINNLKLINDNYGHKLGDTFINEAGKCFLTIEKKYSNLKTYRYGGDEFIMLAYNKKQKEIDKIIHDIRKLNQIKVSEDCLYTLDFAIGCSECNNQSLFNINSLKSDADKLMYKDKHLRKEVKIYDK